jgi:hypothetical protein
MVSGPTEVPCNICLHVSKLCPKWWRSLHAHAAAAQTLYHQEETGELVSTVQLTSTPAEKPPVWSYKSTGIHFRGGGLCNSVELVRSSGLMVGDGLLGILLVGPVGGHESVDLDNNLLTIEQSGSLLQTEALCFDDEGVTEEQLEGEPAAVEDLC